MENRVRVQHFRVPRYYLNNHFVRYYRGSGFANVAGEPRERGGETEAVVVIDGHEFSGLAECSVKDSFCYRIGRQIAIGRLRKQIEPLGWTITADGFVKAMW